MCFLLDQTVVASPFFFNPFANRFVYTEGVEPLLLKQVPVAHKKSLKNIRSQLAAIAYQHDFKSRYSLTLTSMYHAICGHHDHSYKKRDYCSPYKDRTRVIGYISLIMFGLPLISRKCLFKLRQLSRDIDNIKEIKLVDGLKAFCLLAVILPIEFLRVAVSLILTAAYAITAAPIVAAVTGVAKPEQFDENYTQSCMIAN